jgi:hypothetical protein
MEVPDAADPPPAFLAELLQPTANTIEIKIKTRFILLSFSLKFLDENRGMITVCPGSPDVDEMHRELSPSMTISWSLHCHMTAWRMVTPSSIRMPGAVVLVDLVILTLRGCSTDFLGLCRNPARYLNYARNVVLVTLRILQQAQRCEATAKSIPLLQNPEADSPAYICEHPGPKISVQGTNITLCVDCTDELHAGGQLIHPQTMYRGRTWAERAPVNWAPEERERQKKAGK